MTKARIPKTPSIALTAMLSVTALASCESTADGGFQPIGVEPLPALEAAEPRAGDVDADPAADCDCARPQAKEVVDEPRHELPVDGQPAAGPQDAAVTVDVFCDFACPYCKRFAHTLEQLRERFPDDVRVIYRQLPLPMHPQARPAAVAALAAQRQGAFLRMRQLLFERQHELHGADFGAWADEIGLDVSRFERDLLDPRVQALVDVDLATARDVGARGTPTTFINGRRVVGARPLDFYESLVSEALKAR